MLSLLSGLALAQTPPPIVGGSEVTGWPWRQVGAMVATRGSAGGSFCSGTLVEQRRVITAAHCVDGAQSYIDAGYTIHFVVADDISASWDASATVGKMVKHPSYSSSGSPTDDIAVLYLDSAISGFGTMPVSTTSLFPADVGENITYVGYGLTDSDKANSSGVRRKVAVPLYYFDSDFLYTYAGGASKNVCSGDSGGAAMWKRDDGTWELMGVNSFVFDLDGVQADCDSGKPAGGAVRIETTLEFLREHVDIPDEGEGDSDTDSDADSDTDSDADGDTDTDTDTGVNDSGPGTDDTGGGGEPSACLGCASSMSSPAGAGLGVLLLVGLLWRRRD